MKEDKKIKRLKFYDDLLKNHNHSWAHDIVERNLNNLHTTAIFYRGTTITYLEMFENMIKYAASLKELGITKGMEIPMCLENTPETIYLLLAASLIGAKVNIFGEEFSKDYIKEIINDTDAKILFITDTKYSKLVDIKKEENILDDTNIEKIVMFSVMDSYTENASLKKEYAEKEKGYFDGVNRVPLYKVSNSKVIDREEFISLGKSIIDSLSYTSFYGKMNILEEKSDLEDIFSITYSSGSTNSERPKAIVHRVRSFNAIAKAHDKDMGDTPEMKGFRCQVQIPTHSNTCIISTIADTLAQGCTCTLEYIYDEDFFLNSLLINKPSYCIATRSHWLKAMKHLNSNKAYEGVNLTFLLVPLAAGEPLAPGEEKFLNKMLRKKKAGKDVLPLPISPVCMSMAGGDCEHGGIFYQTFKSLREIPNKLKRKGPLGLRSYAMVDYEVLDKYGRICYPGETGRLVATSPCDMAYYKNNEEATREFFITDAYGRTWGDCNVYAEIDELGTVHIKGRIPKEKMQYPDYIYQEVICKDTKNVLSCEVVQFKTEGGSDAIVVHVEPMPNVHIDIDKFLKSLDGRIRAELPRQAYEDKIVYKLRNGFPLTGCGKRNNRALIKEGLENTFKVTIANDEVILENGKEFFKAKDEMRLSPSKEKTLQLKRVDNK